MNDSYIMASGITLSRKLYGENTYYTTLFLKDYGIINATARATMYPGEREPLIWAKFKLRKKSRSRNYFIEDTDIQDDMLALRKDKEHILTALNWCRLVTKYLEPSQPDNSLLANLYWNMKIMCDSVPPKPASWRFMWKWLVNWGLAPDSDSFFASFSHNARILLEFVAQSEIKSVTEFFRSNQKIFFAAEDFFVKAYNLSQGLLNEK